MKRLAKKKEKENEKEIEADLEWLEAGKPYTRTDPEGKFLAESIIENTPSGYIWCMHCERVFDLWEILPPGFAEYCDCGGAWYLDGQDWGELRRQKPGLPVTPQVGVVYPLYPEKGAS